jgi:hypothetical protein
MRGIFLQPGPFGMDEITRKRGFEKLQTLWGGKGVKISN